MVLKLYNTLTKTKEEFKPINDNEVGIYTCGPTVYWFAHVGNLRAYIFSDLLTQVLKFNNYKVRRVINVTDVGHLTSDSDEGNDKLEQAASKEGKTATEISQYYFDAFLKDYTLLNLEEPTVWSWATKHISEQIDLIKSLEEKGFTYETSDGVYFDTSKFPAYGVLSKKNIAELKEGKRVDMRDKRNKTDFALWKFSNPSEKRQQEWESPWGIGFPGWHIECSAMSAKYLGTHFDIHTGGEDHIPIHHENEIAQSECGYGVDKSVNYWMHNAFLVLPGGKMSKSKGTIKTISQLKEEGFEPLAYKYFTYSALYRSPLTWSLDGLANAQTALNKLRSQVSSLKDDGDINKEYLDKFTDAINDDLNTPKALVVLFSLLKNKEAKGKVSTIQEFDHVLKLDLFKEDEKIVIPEEVVDLVNQREKLRQAKDWSKSDELRDLVNSKGFSIKDTPEGPEITIKS